MSTTGIKTTQVRWEYWIMAVNQQKDLIGTCSTPEGPDWLIDRRNGIEHKGVRRVQETRTGTGEKESLLTKEVHKSSVARIGRSSND